MPALIECPPIDRLERLTLGKLAAGESESISLHVLQCDSCAATVAELTARDTLAEALGHVP